jgi:hypothetical protein
MRKPSIRRVMEVAAITYRCFSTIPVNPNHRCLPSVSPPWWSPMMRDTLDPPLHLAGFVCEVIPGPGPFLQLPQAAVSASGLTSSRRDFSLFISTRFFHFFSHFWTLPLNYLALSERKVSQPRLVVHVLYRHFIPNGVEMPMMIK